MNDSERIIALSRLCRYNVNGECSKACLDFLHLFDESIHSEVKLRLDCDPFVCPAVKQ